MSETKKRNYEMTQLHYITDGKKIEPKQILDKNGNEAKEPIIIKGPEELKRGGYVVIQAETTRGRKEGKGYCRGMILATF